MDVSISSEIGELKGVLLHKPGYEIERMTPQNANEALYSDILNKSIVEKEYGNFEGVLSKYTQTYQLKQLLEEALQEEWIRKTLVTESCKLDDCLFLVDELLELPVTDLSSALIEGYAYQKGRHSSYFEKERYILKPLYNLFYTRDIASVVYDEVMIHPMAFKVREKERLLIHAIMGLYKKFPLISALNYSSKAKTEGGDLLVVREDVICVGNGLRTNKKGIEFLIENYRSKKKKFSIIVQELPEEPESFIHLDMVFTFLDKHTCMTYEPLIMKKSGFESYHTHLIQIDNGKLTTKKKNNMFEALSAVGVEVKPVLCGGVDEWDQHREQWHSGANFFAMGEGKIIGYARNTHTIEALHKEGFDVLSAQEVCTGNEDLSKYSRFVVTLEASELPRGGGGARCMTLPLEREIVNW